MLPKQFASFLLCKLVLLKFHGRNALGNLKPARTLAAVWFISVRVLLNDTDAISGSHCLGQRCSVSGKVAGLFLRGKNIHGLFAGLYKKSGVLQLERSFLCKWSL